MNQIEMDPVTRQYRLNGNKVPGVTKIIKAGGLQLDWMPDDWYFERGRAVHLVTALDDLGDLDESTVDDRIMPYLTGWRRFRAESSFKIEAEGIEKRVSNTQYRFCGTLDRLGRIRKRRGVLDIKCGQPEPWHQIQLAGYALCLRNSYALARWSLYLKDDGDFRLKPCRDLNDFRIFICATSITNWKSDYRLED